ncbi:MAG: hypothetical protein AAB578_03480, partial [Elusimicrobiota bacterium]
MFGSTWGMRPAAACALVLGGTLLSVRVWSAFKSNVLPLDDQGANLALSIQLMEAGGFPGFLTGCWTGTYQEARRHPLLPMLLSSWAVRDSAFFDRACVVMLFLSALAWIAFFLLIARLHDHLEAFVSLGWISVLAAPPLYASRIGPEALLAPLSGAAWVLSSSAQPAAGYAAGACLGLGYLLKGTGLLFALACLFGAWLGSRDSSQALRIVGSFLFISSPLLVRN